MQINNKLKNGIFILFLIISILTIVNLFYTFSDLRTTIVNLIIIIAYVLLLLNLLVYFLIHKLSKSTFRNICTAIIIIMLGFGLFRGNEFLNNYREAFAMMNRAGVYSTSLVTFSDSPIENENDINSSTRIGIQGTNSFVNGQFAFNQIREANLTNNISTFTSIEEAYQALKAGEVDLITTSGLTDEELVAVNPEAALNMRVVKTFEQEQEQVTSNVDITNTPFTVLIQGIDSRTTDINSVANSDSNIIVTFNPNTGHITTLTTPRDSFVQIQCAGFGWDKLTHSASYGGAECTRATLEAMYDIKIDYIVRINFTGVVDIVNALGGIDVDVPVNQMNLWNPNVCEQDSRGNRGTICWVEGEVNHFDGEQALAFSRNRYNQDGGDFYRGRNQQIVINAILQRMRDINNFDTINSLISAAGNNIATNLDRNAIISLYEILISLNNQINLEKLYVGGTTGDVGGMSVVHPDPTAMAYASYRMKVTLGLVYPQFPTNNDYFVLGQEPSADSNDAFAIQRASFDGIEQPRSNNNRQN